jgi:hypothetical protein
MLSMPSDTTALLEKLLTIDAGQWRDRETMLTVMVSLLAREYDDDDDAIATLEKSNLIPKLCRQFMKPTKVMEWADSSNQWKMLLEAADALQSSHAPGEPGYDKDATKAMYTKFKSVPSMGGSTQYMAHRLWRSYCLSRGQDLPIGDDWFGMTEVCARFVYCTTISIYMHGTHTHTHTHTHLSHARTHNTQTRIADVRSRTGGLCGPRTTRLDARHPRSRIERPPWCGGAEWVRVAGRRV